MSAAWPAMDDEPDDQVVASVWGRGGGGAAARRAAGIVFVAAGLTVPGLLLGAPLGILVGAAHTWLAGTGTAHGQGDLLILVTFGPLGALLGGAVLPAFYLVRLLRKWWSGTPADGGGRLPGRRGRR